MYISSKRYSLLITFKSLIDFIVRCQNKFISEIFKLFDILFIEESSLSDIDRSLSKEPKVNFLENKLRIYSTSFKKFFASNPSLKIF